MNVEREYLEEGKKAVIEVGDIITFKDISSHYLVITNYIPSKIDFEEDIFSYNLLVLEENKTLFSCYIDTIDNLINEVELDLVEVIKPKDYFLKITK